MARPRGAHDGGDSATESLPTESVPGASASEKMTMKCHLLQVRWTAAHFDTRKYSILEFANEFMRINAGRGLSVTRETIVVYWTMIIWSFYGDGNTTSNRLKSQV